MDPDASSLSTSIAPFRTVEHVAPCIARLAYGGVADDLGRAVRGRLAMANEWLPCLHQGEIMLDILITQEDRPRTLWKIWAKNLSHAWTARIAEVSVAVANPQQDQ